jgi:hypothetical protein
MMEDVAIAVFDSFGRLIYKQEKCNSGDTIRLERQAAGTYYIRFSNAQGIWLQKLVII